jgi:hypothetical protein
MKKYLILFIAAILYFSITTNAQYKIIEHHYSFDTAKINKGHDTLIISGTDSIKVTLKNTTLIDGKQLIRISQLKNDDESEDMTNTLSSKHLLIKEGSPLKLVITFRDTSTSSNITSVAVAPTEKKFVLVLYKANEKIEKTVDEKIKEVVKEILKDLFSESTKKEKIGIFHLDTNSISLKTKVKVRDNTKTLKVKSTGDTTFKYRDSIYYTQVKVDSVSITLANGAIAKRGLLVKLSNGEYYRNRQAPISLSNKRYEQYLEIDNFKRDKHIQYSQVLNYIFISKFYYPDNGTITLSKKRDSAYLENKSTISDILDMSIYSDLLSLVGRNPNGIIQTELSAHFITNTKNRANKDFTWWSFVNPYFSLSKFDSKFQQIDSSRLGKTVKDSIDRLYINQTAYLRAGIKVNVIKLGMWPNEELQINTGAELVLTNADSIFKKDIVTINYYPEILYKVNRMENFGLEASMRWLLQIPAQSLGFYNSKPRVFFNPQVTMYYYPFSDPNKRIYLRYNHFAEVGAGKSNYPQIQFGYKTNLFKKD